MSFVFLTPQDAKITHLHVTHVKQQFTLDFVDFGPCILFSSVCHCCFCLAVALDLCLTWFFCRNAAYIYYKISMKQHFSFQYNQFSMWWKTANYKWSKRKKKNTLRQNWDKLTSDFLPKEDIKTRSDWAVLTQSKLYWHNRFIEITSDFKQLNN